MPLHVDAGDAGLTLDDLAAQVAQARQALDGAGWLSDLPLRVPELAAMTRPVAAVAPAGVKGDGRGLVLHLPDGAADRLVLTDGRRAFGESNRRHDYRLRPVGDDYHGRHRLEDSGIPARHVVVTNDDEFEAWLRSVTPPPYP